MGFFDKKTIRKITLSVISRMKSSTTDRSSLKRSPKNSQACRKPLILQKFMQERDPAAYDWTSESLNDRAETRN